ncbi:hypothetical protein B0T24DRAFT_630751 [Lasiosphaeria ovina]|uniref:Uncharacterized protein n=1 Tax=Lasiosphaeria ovina TaxID=92902 RepID=A0AAE0K3C0_9PEZI|nr:hypothetical protein B0T24DRAFT_630751 [Lasiosphaeria ovina]
MALRGRVVELGYAARPASRWQIFGSLLSTISSLKMAPPAEPSKKLFHLLTSPRRIDLDGYADRISALMVVNPADPIGGPHCPNIRDARNPIARLTPDVAAQGSDIKFLEEKAESDDAKLLAAKVAGIWGDKIRNRSQGMAAPFFKRYEIPNAQAAVLGVLNQMDGAAKTGTAKPLTTTKRPDPEPKDNAVTVWSAQSSATPTADQPVELAETAYKNTVGAWAEQQREINNIDAWYVLVNYIVLEDPVKAASATQASSLGASIDPDAAGALALGAPPVLSMSAQTATEQHSEASASYDGDYLVACSYLTVRENLSTPPKGPKLFNKAKKFLTRSKSRPRFTVSMMALPGNLEAPLGDDQQPTAPDGRAATEEDDVFADIVLDAPPGYST